jgi:hypothetical protein
MHEPGPISLSDGQLSVITQLAEPLAPPDRSAFLAALAQLLRHEPQPLGDGAVFRSAKQLLATGHYTLNSAVATGVAGVARHNGRSALRNGAPTAHSQSK